MERAANAPTNNHTRASFPSPVGEVANAPTSTLTYASTRCPCTNRECSHSHNHTCVISLRRGGSGERFHINTSTHSQFPFLVERLANASPHPSIHKCVSPSANALISTRTYASLRGGAANAPTSRLKHAPFPFSVGGATNGPTSTHPHMSPGSAPRGSHGRFFTSTRNHSSSCSPVGEPRTLTNPHMRPLLALWGES